MASSASTTPGVSPAATAGRDGTRPPREPRPPLALLVLAVLTARVAVLVWLLPYDLVADEAHYWEWSRRPALSYYSKGPGVAWAIGASTAAFGDHEWSVRLPAAVFAALAMVGLAGLGAACAGGDRRVGLAAAAAYALAPGYQAVALLATIDGPLLAFWILSAWAAWRVVRRLEAGGSALGPSLAFAAALGAGFLCKYTILLLLPGVLVFGFVRRRHVRWTPARAAELLAALPAFLLLASPVIIWNAQVGSPTVRHLLGAVGLPGGDIPQHGGERWAYDPLWTLSLVGAQLGILGPPLAALIGLALWRSLRSRRRRRADPASAADLFLILCAAPILIFYLGMTVLHKAQGNWPMAAFATLLVLAARHLVAARTVPNGPTAPAGEASTSAPEASPPPSDPRTPPSHRAFRIAWRWTVGFGLATGLGVLALPLVARLPLVGHLVPMHRLTGHRQMAQQLSEDAADLSRTTGRTPFIIADHYGRASLLAFYLPGRPRVYCAAAYLGQRQSQYDYFPDTRLTDPALVGRPTLLVGSRPDRWTGAFVFDRVQRLPNQRPASRPNAWPDAFAGLNYQGVRSP